MSNSNFIEFKKERKAGEMLTDTFGFLRAEFKPLAKVFFAIVLPTLVVMLLANGAMIYFTGMGSTSAVGIGVSSLIFIVAMLFAYAYSQSTVLYYIKSYIDNKGQINEDEIKSNVKSSVGRFIGLSFTIGITVGFGFLLLIIPGVYAVIPLSLAFCFLVFKNQGVSEAFSSSFALAKGYWWSIFGCIFLVGLIVMVLTYLFAMPAALYDLFRIGFISGSLEAPTFDIISLFLNLIGTFAQYVLGVITIVCTAFIYFDLNEIKHQTGALEQIDALGADETEDSKEN